MKDYLKETAKSLDEQIAEAADDLSARNQFDADEHKERVDAAAKLVEAEKKLLEEERKRLENCAGPWSRWRARRKKSCARRRSWATLDRSGSRQSTAKSTTLRL